MADPRARVLLVLAVGGFALVLDHPLGLGVLAAITGSALLAVGGRWRLHALAVAAAVVWSTILSQGLFYADSPRTPLVELGPVAVWREGVLHGLVQSLRLLAMGAAGSALAISTPPDRLFAGLIGLRVPHGAAFLAVTGLRFVPVAAAEWWAVREARARRGRPIVARAPWRWLAEEMRTLRPVAARTVRRARTLAESLDVRGFDPDRPRRLRTPLRMGPADVAVVGATWSALALAATAEALYRAYLWDVAWHPALRPLYGWVRAWL